MANLNTKSVMERRVQIPCTMRLADLASLEELQLKFKRRSLGEYVEEVLLEHIAKHLPSSE